MPRAASGPILRGLLLALAVALAGCDRARLSEVEELSGSGVALAEAMPALYDASYVASVEADGATLAASHRDLPAGARAAAFQDTYDQLRERREILDRLAAHSRELRRYFAALDDLAGADAPAEISDAAGDAVAELGKLSPGIAAARIGGQSIGALAEQGAAIIVRARISRALDARLEADADLIAHELDLQSAALTALSDAMASDVEFAALTRLSSEVREPFIAARRLPPGWQDAWTSSLSPRAESEALAAAAKAMKRVRKAWQALAEAEADAGLMARLRAEVDDALALVEIVKG